MSDYRVGHMVSVFMGDRHKKWRPGAILRVDEEGTFLIAAATGTHREHLEPEEYLVIEQQTRPSRAMCLGLKDSYFYDDNIRTFEEKFMQVLTQGGRNCRVPDYARSQLIEIYSGDI